MISFVGIGSNLGDRRANLEQAARALKNLSAGLFELSPVYETPAMLPKNGDSSWNLPFLNAAAKMEFKGSAQELLIQLKQIESKLGRSSKEKGTWAPRPLDLDILLFGDQVIDEQDLQVPHPGLLQRNFVLAPLRDLAPEVIIPQDSSEAKPLSVLEAHRRLSTPLPAWMNIVNLTPDSFSDGNEVNKLKPFSDVLDQIEENNVGIVDIGAESTRPKAQELNPVEEWQRLHPFLEGLQRRFSNLELKPLISLDTRNWQTAAKGLEWGVNIVNDVSGLSHQSMIDLVKDSRCQCVFMHSLSLPAEPQTTLPKDCDPVAELEMWLEKKLNFFENNGLDLSRLIFDPGIGFGKTAAQSLEILKRIESFKKFPVRLLVGHSRKSFMNNFTKAPFGARDPESMGVSLNLAARGVDIIRVHNANLHKRAHLAQTHLAQTHLTEQSL